MFWSGAKNDENKEFCSDLWVIWWIKGTLMYWWWWIYNHTAAVWIKSTHKMFLNFMSNYKKYMYFCRLTWCFNRVYPERLLNLEILGWFYWKFKELSCNLSENVRFELSRSYRKLLCKTFVLYLIAAVIHFFPAAVSAVSADISCRLNQISPNET